MKCLVIVGNRRAAFGDIFRDQQLALLQFIHALFEGRRDRAAFRIDDAVENRRYFPIDIDDFLFQLRSSRLSMGDLRVPRVAEGGGGEFEQFPSRDQGPHHHFERIFDPFALDRLVHARAATLAAEIVRVHAVTPLRPTGRQGVVAIAAKDMTPKREIRVQVHPVRRTNLA